MAVLRSYLSGVTLDPKERELQVSLAELQADVQIYLTAAFGFLAVFAALVLTDEQIFYSLQSDQTLEKVAFFWTILIGGIGCVLTFAYYAKRAKTARNKMGKLRLSPKQHDR